MILVEKEIIIRVEQKIRIYTVIIIKKKTITEILKIKLKNMKKMG
jgi:hypothetical protein